MGYYMGDFYRGDPGFLGFLKKGLGFVSKLGIPGVSTVAGVASGVMPGGARVAQAALPAATGGITGAIKSVAGRASTAIIKHPVLSAAGAAGALGAAAGMEFSPSGQVTMTHGGMHLKKTLKHCGMPLKSGRIGKCHRSMNVCNPRALRRAIRRTRGFAKLAMKTIHIVHPKKKGRFGGFKTRRRK